MHFHLHPRFTLVLLSFFSMSEVWEAQLELPCVGPGGAHLGRALVLVLAQVPVLSTTAPTDCEREVGVAQSSEDSGPNLWL